MGLGLALAAFTGLCWAVLAIGLKYALHFASTGNIVWTRMAFAFAMLVVILFIQEPKSILRILKRSRWMILFAGLFLAVNYFTYMKGLEMTSASNAQIMIQLGPIAFLVMGVGFFNEVLRFKQWVGVGIALTGFALFNWDQLQVTAQNISNISSAEQAHQYLLGNLWLIVGAIGWAIFAAIQKQLIQKYSWKPQELNLLIYGICTVALFPMAHLASLRPLDAFQWFILFLLGLNTLLAYGAFAEANRLAPASLVSLIISCNPLLTILVLKIAEQAGSNFVSPEPIFWSGYLGAALVVMGVAIAVYFKKRPSPLPIAVE